MNVQATLATLAVLVKNGNAVGTCVTTAKNGAIIAFGKQKLKNGGIVEIGRAKISRAKKYLDDKELMYDLEMSNKNYLVNNSNYMDA